MKERRKNKMRVGILHPPIYPMSIDFFNLLGEKCDLIVYQIGSRSISHKEWETNKFLNDSERFHLKIYGTGCYSQKKSFNPKIYKDIKEDKLDILINASLWAPSFLIGLFNKRFCKKHVIWTNIKYDMLDRISFLRYWWRKGLSLKCDSFLTGTTDATDYFKSVAKKRPVYQVVQTMDTKKWISDIETLPSKGELRKKLNLPEDQVVVLGVGNLIVRKNWGSVLQSMKDMHDNVLFLLVGDGPQKSSLTRTAREFNLRDRLLILNNRSHKDLKEIYKVADVFVLPSFHDTFGFVVQEAMTAGLPILCSRNAGARHLVEDTVNGFVIGPMDHYGKEIEKTIKHREKMGRNSLLKIKKYGVEEYSNRFIQALNKIMED